MKKTWQIVENGEVISRHIDFYHAQDYIHTLFNQGKISNSYDILPIPFLTRKEYLQHEEQEQMQMQAEAEGEAEAKAKAEWEWEREQEKNDHR